MMIDPNTLNDDTWNILVQAQNIEDCRSQLSGIKDALGDAPAIDDAREHLGDYLELLVWWAANITDKQGPSLKGLMNRN
jgi:hypothetical protein